MASYNRIIIIGNLTRDPEIKEVSAGQSMCRFSIASNREFKQRQTDIKTQETCFVDIDVWGHQAESCHKFLKKGRGVLIEGRLKFDTWQDKQDTTRTKHTILAERVVFLDSKDQSNDKIETFTF